MGKTGAQFGNKNISSATSTKDALRYAMANHADDKVARGQALKKICMDIVKEALAGDWRAREFIVDRTEGKATQTTNVNITKTTIDLTNDELLTIASGNGIIIEADSQDFTH